MSAMRVIDESNNTVGAVDADLEGVDRARHVTGSAHEILRC